MRAIATAWALTALATTAGAAPAAGQPPVPGAYQAQMCVTVAAHERKCGAVELTLRPADEVVLKVDDIRYRLRVRVGTQVDVFVFHGSMQIDEFSATGRWLGNSLEWFDQAKNTRYLVQLGARVDAAVAEAPPAPASSPN